MAQETIQYPEHEAAFIASVFMSPETNTELLDRCEHAMFATPKYSSVVSAMKTLVAESKPIDFLMLRDQLVALGWPESRANTFLLDIDKAHFVSTNAEFYLQKVVEAWGNRQVLQVNYKNLSLDEKLEKMQEVKDSVKDAIKEKEIVDNTAHALKIAIDTINDPLDGLRTSLPFSRDIPLHKSFYTVIGALSGTGKTVAGTQMAYDLLKQGKRVAYISTEMSGAALFKRMFSQSQKTTAGHVLTGSVSNAAKEGIQEEFNKFDFILADKENSTVEGIYNMCKTKQPDIVFVDYIQRTHTEKDFKDSEVARLTHITRTLKSITIDFEIPVVTFAQFNREAAKAKTPPSLEAALKGAGSIFEDADLAMLLWRDTDPETKKKLNTGIMRVEKYRHGPQPDDYNIELDTRHMLFKEVQKKKEDVFSGTI